MTDKSKLPAGITINKTYGRKTKWTHNLSASVYVYPDTKGHSRLCVNKAAAEALGFKSRDLVVVAALSDGRFALLKDETGNTLHYQGKSSTLTLTLSVACLKCEASIENGVAYFPEGSFFEIGENG